MVSCVRLMAVAKGDAQAILFYTEMVLLPYYMRTSMTDLHAIELSLWDHQTRESFGRLSGELATTAASLLGRFSGQYVVVKAKYKDATFVEKICRVCGKGVNGEKLFSCVRCGLVYYCGKTCQRAHWSFVSPAGFAPTLRPAPVPSREG